MWYSTGMDNEELGRIFDGFDKMFEECPELIVKPDSELLRLADELVEGVEL